MVNYAGLDCDTERGRRADGASASTCESIPQYAFYVFGLSVGAVCVSSARTDLCRKGWQTLNTLREPTLYGDLNVTYADYQIPDDLMW